MSNNFTTRAVRQRAGALVKDAVAATSNIEVARRLKIGAPTIHRWARGERLPIAVYAKRIFRVLGSVAS